MYKQSKKAFTLVELIVVITILAILGTIAFISLQGYSSSARNSRRIADVNNIKTSLELFILNSGVYPIPDNGEEVSYSGDLLWTQGIVGDNVSTNLSRNLNKKPIDPLMETEYIYSVSNTKKEFELLSFYEGNLANNSILNTTNAATNYTPKISGTFNGIFLKTTNYIFPTPSLVTSEDLPLDFNLNNLAIRSQVISDGDNFPNLTGKTSTGKLNINLSVYTGNITKDSTEQEKIDVITAIQNTYSGSTIASQAIYANILNTSDSVALAEQLILFKPNSDNKTISNNNCSLNEEVINHGMSKTYYESNMVIDTCISEIRTCNNGILSGSYIYDSCEDNLLSPSELIVGNPVRLRLSTDQYDIGYVFITSTEPYVILKNQLPGTYQYNSAGGLLAWTSSSSYTQFMNTINGYDDVNLKSPQIVGGGFSPYMYISASCDYNIDPPKPFMDNLLWTESSSDWVAYFSTTIGYYDYNHWKCGNVGSSSTAYRALRPVFRINSNAKLYWNSDNLYYEFK